MATTACLMLGMVLSLLCKADAASKDPCIAPITNKGREFEFGVLTARSGQSLSILITADQGGSVEMTAPRLGPVPTIHQLTKGSTEIAIDNAVVSTVTGITTNGIRLKADVDIQVMLQSNDYSSDEIILLIPIEALSTTYTVVSTQGYSGFTADFLIAAPFNDTNVYIRFAKGNETNMNITLNQHQCFQHKAVYNTYDLTGTVIKSNKPIYVVAGSRLTSIPFGITYISYIADTMLPRDTWDNLYIVPPNPPQRAYMVKIVHGDTDTTVTMSNHSNTRNKTLSDKDHVDFISGMDPLVVRSDAPVMVAQFGTSYSVRSQDIGNPFLTVVPGVNQYLNRYDFIVPTFPNTFSNYLAITVPTAVEAELILDGGPVNVTYRYPVSRPLDNYTVLVTSVPEGLHHIYSRNNTPFGALLYGYFSAYSYGGSIGLSLYTTGNKTCHASSTVLSPVSTTVPNHVSTTVPNHVSTTLPKHVSLTVPNHVSTTVPHHVSTRGPGNQCMSCADMTHPGLCDHIQRCSSNQTCFVERYQLPTGETRYRSGCRDQAICIANVIDTADSCEECCSGDFCNLHGCGVDKIPRDKRGPLCYECAHVSHPEECHQTTVCGQQQICGIEKHSWFGSLFHYKMGCQNQVHCLARRKRVASLTERSSLLCLQCCKDDFCNDRCQTNSAPSIIG